jgi:hypothetical protein
MSSKGLCNCRALSQIMFNTGENCEAIPSRSFIAGLSNTNGFHIPDRVTCPMPHVLYTMPRPASPAKPKLRLRALQIWFITCVGSDYVHSCHFEVKPSSRTP